MRTLPALTCLLFTIASVLPAAAVTRFQVQSDAGDPIGRGDAQTFSSPDAAFVGMTATDTRYAGIEVTRYSSPSFIESSWQVAFSVPSPEGLQPGTYDAVYEPLVHSEPGPHIDVVHDGSIPNDSECRRGTGRF